MQIFDHVRAALTGGRVLAAVVAATSSMCVCYAALAQDNWLQFGPVERTGYSSATYDREFVREWERNPPKGFPTLSKANIEPTKAAIKRYQEIVAQGGWPQLPQMQLEAGVTDSSVILLRRRLIASGDLASDSGGGPYFDLALEKAVKRFQAANGLTPTGIVDKRTVPALNVPADARLKQLKANLSRLQGLTSSPGKKHVVVNIPAAQIEAVENGKIVARYTGVVGKPDRPTPILRSTISQLNFNPVWRLPPTVISKDLIPKGREMQKKGQDVLAKYGIDAFDGATGKKLDSSKINWAGAAPGGYSFSQQPGKENPLGFVKINFANSDSVYMHDTPSESLFGRNFRAASSGCIRVLGIEDLVTWLLAEQGGWSHDKVLAVKELGTRLDVNLKKPVPLHFIYLTAWATEDGVVQFRRDLYQRDGVGEVASAY